MDPNQILQGDCLARMRELPDESVNCCVTSPPYWGLRDYGVAGQLGMEATPEEYVQHMVEVFREVRRIVRADGTLWLNLGDSYNGTGGGQKNDNSPKQLSNQGAKTAAFKNGKNVENLKPKDIVGIPWMVAFALRADGWYLRSDIIWAKPNPMPESVTDRPTKSHEYIFLLSKNQKYYYDSNAIKEPVAESTIGRGPVDFGGKKGRETQFAVGPGDPRYRGGPEGTQWGKTFDYRKSCANGRNKRDVWTIATKPFAEAHFATFPPDLIKPCILAGCPVGGIVLDPFGGSGTTAQVALENCRKFILTELNPAYIEIAMRRLRPHLAQQKLIEA